MKLKTLEGYYLKISRKGKLKFTSSPNKATQFHNDGMFSKTAQYFTTDQSTVKVFKEGINSSNKNNTVQIDNGKKILFVKLCSDNEYRIMKTNLNKILYQDSVKNILIIN